MFDFINAYNFGRKITSNGKKYNIMRALEAGYVLAVRNEDDLPAPVYVIKIEEEDKKRKS